MKARWRKYLINEGISLINFDKAKAALKVILERVK